MFVKVFWESSNRFVTEDSVVNGIREAIARCNIQVGDCVVTLMDITTGEAHVLVHADDIPDEMFWQDIKVSVIGILNNSEFIGQ